MKLCRQMVPIAVALGIGLILGMIVRNAIWVSSGQRAGGDSGRGDPIGEAGSALFGEGGGGPQSGLERERKTRDALDASSRAHRVLWFATQAESARAEDMPRLMRLAGGDSVISKMIASRWSTIDPEHMLESLVEDLRSGRRASRNSYDLLRGLFSEWSKTDPHAVAKVLEDDSLFPGIGGVRFNVTDYLMKSDVELGLTMLDRWGLSHYYPSMGRVPEWAASNPRRAAEFVLKHGVANTGIEAMKGVGKAWAQSDPMAALAFAAGVTGEGGRKLAEGVIGEWARLDLEAAIAWASGTEQRYLKAEAGKRLVEEWAKTDPGAALEWTNSHLQGQARADAMGKLIGTLANRDLGAAAELVSGMDPGGAMNQAASGLLKSWMKTDRVAAFSWLAELPNREAALRAIESVQWQWVMNEPAEVEAFITGPHAHLAPNTLVRNIAGDKARQNPLAALEWANALPAAIAENARGSIVNAWAWSQPGHAAAWASELPPGELRADSIGTLARVAGYRDATAAIEFLTSLPEGDRAAARSGIESSGIKEGTRRRLLDALR